MAIAYKSQGAGVVTEASGGALSPLSPATVDANDILIAHAWYEGTTTTPSTPSGYTLLGGPYTVESAYRHWVFGKLAAGTEDGAAVPFGTPAVTTMRAARVYSFSGWVSGTITDNVPAASFAHLSHATDPQMPTVTTTITGGLAVAVVGQADDNPQASPTGESGGDWVEAVAEFVSAATTPDVALGIHTCTPTANPGTVSGGTIATLNDPCGVIGFEIRPSVPANPITVTPGVLALTLTTFAPILKLVVIPGLLSLSLATFAPTVTVAPAGVTVTPTTLSLTTTAFAPTVSVSDNKLVTPTTAAETLATFAPTVSVTNNQLITPSTAAFTLTGFAPTIITPVVSTPDILALILSSHAPTITVGTEHPIGLLKPYCKSFRGGRSRR